VAASLKLAGMLSASFQTCRHRCAADSRTVI